MGFRTGYVHLRKASEKVYYKVRNANKLWDIGLRTNFQFGKNNANPLTILVHL